MIKQLIGTWAAMQTLLVQVAAIKGEVADDVPTINRALTIYRNFLACGLTENEIDKLYQACAAGKIDRELLK